MSTSNEVSPSLLTDPDTWVEQHGDALFQYAMTRMGNRQVAEDLVQETFIAALRSKGFDGRSSERTWFIAILKHKMIDHLRRSKREQTLQSQSDEARETLFDDGGMWRQAPSNWPADASDSLESKEFWQTFGQCLDKLPDRLRAVFTMREIDQKSTSELCEELQVTPGNMSVLLYRARAGLRRCLEVNWFSVEGEAG